MLKNLANHLPYFSCVAKHLSFSHAATELAVSQSAISYQIKCLEDKLGFKLFVRGQGSKVEFSHKGEKLYQEYIVLERNFNQVLSDTQLNKNRTNLNIAAPVDIGVKLLIPALSQFSPDKLIINFDLNDELVNLKKSNFDFSIRNNTNEHELEYVPLVSIKNQLICSQDYALKHNLSSFQDITPETHLITRNAEKSKSWQALFNQHNLDFHQHENVQSINNVFGIYQGIIGNNGLGILPEYFVSDANQTNLFIFDEKIIETHFYLAFQPSYIANKWATIIKTKIVNYFKFQKLT